MQRLIVSFMAVIGLFLGGFIWWFIHQPALHPPRDKADAIVLLAGSYKERAPAAAQLYRAGYAPAVLLTNDGILSSWSSKYGRNLYQIDLAEKYLVTLGVPRERIVKLPFHGSSTMHDALAVRQYALAHGLTKMIIVTSDYHIRRAIWTFRKVFAGHQAEFEGYAAVSVGTGVKVFIVESAKMTYYLVVYGLLGLFPHESGLKP